MNIIIYTYILNAKFRGKASCSCAGHQYELYIEPYMVIVSIFEKHWIRFVFYTYL